ncbi:MAG: helix-turn-helix domain-containing protein [Pseudomonadota bacterium]
MNTNLHNFETGPDFDEFIASAEEGDLEHFISLHPEHTKIMQLGAGFFSGAVQAANFGNFSVHLVTCNQLVEKEVCLGDDKLAFSVCADARAPNPNSPASSGEHDRVLVMPSGCKTVLISPADSMSLIVTVNSVSLFAEPILLPDMVTWFNQSNGQGEFLQSAIIADRLREACHMALSLHASDRPAEERLNISTHLLTHLATGLTLDWLSRQSFKTCPKPSTVTRFQLARDLLLKCGGMFDAIEKRRIDSLGCRRSVENAFSETIKMGPVEYSRVLRLNNAREKIHNATFAEASIGDIAAEEGFWDWSRFSSYYRKQFGELPSHARR